MEKRKGPAGRQKTPPKLGRLCRERSSPRGSGPRDEVLVAAVEPGGLTALLTELETAEAGAVIPDEGTEPVAPRKSNAPTLFLQIQKGQGVLKIPLTEGAAKEDAGDERTPWDP